MLDTILFTIIGILSIVCFKLASKNRKMSDRIASISEQIRNFNISSNRKGYYTIHATQAHKDTGNQVKVECIIFVKEIDRYTSGESKLELVDMNLVSDESSFSPDSMKKFIENNFKVIRNTNEITWLESETDIKEVRKSKLDKIKETLLNQS